MDCKISQALNYYYYHQTVDYNETTMKASVHGDLSKNLSRNLSSFVRLPDFLFKDRDFLTFVEENEFLTCF